MQLLTGKAASQGLAVEKAKLIHTAQYAVPQHQIDDAAQEINRFETAYAKVSDRLQALGQKAQTCVGAKEAAIFTVHQAIIQDPYSFIEPVKQAIREKHLNAAKAVDEQLDCVERIMSGAKNELFKGRAADFKDIREQFLMAFLGVDAENEPNDNQAYILVTHELTPSMTMDMDLSLVKGIVAEVGGTTSHASIIARSRGIPAVLGVEGAMEKISTGMRLIVDGTNGTVLAEPDAVAIFKAEAEMQAQRNTAEQLARFRGRESETKDGKKLLLYANVGCAEDAVEAKKDDAEGIGLFRSEFLFLNRETLPTEEEQFAQYRKVAEHMERHPVIIRTLDVGGDKQQRSIHVPKEDNPFLGCRAIRLCFRYPEIFRTQLRALLRASAFGNLWIMFPMISSIEELKQAKAYLEEAKQSLRAEKVAYNPDIPVGMMIEVPAAAVLAEEFAQSVDFFSIGTNDLIQYTVAVDRGNEGIAGLYTSYHPAVLRLIDHVCTAAKKHGIVCGICGEAGGDAALLPVWIGMGIAELSVSSKRILELREKLSGLCTEACRDMAKNVLHCASAEEVRTFLKRGSETK